MKSDPSPGYISRVAAVFINDGNKIRGDMQAVFTAMFTDPEARAGDTAPQAGDGHLREPILWTTDIMRGLGFVNVDPNNYWENLSNKTLALGERPFQSPAVFNFFPPNYVIPGTSLNAPEFGLENTANVVGRLTLANNMVFNYIGGFNVDLSATSPLGQIVVSQGPAALVNALSNLFLYGTMDSNTAAAITNEISTVTNPAQQVRLATLFGPYVPGVPGSTLIRERKKHWLLAIKYLCCMKRELHEVLIMGNFAQIVSNRC